MGLKQFAKVQLDQPLPRLAPSQDDVLLDPLGDNKRRRFAHAQPQPPEGFGTRAIVRLAVFPTIIFPDCVGSLRRRLRKIEPQAFQPVIKLITVL